MLFELSNATIFYRTKINMLQGMDFYHLQEKKLDTGLESLKTVTCNT